MRISKKIRKESHYNQPNKDAEKKKLDKLLSIREKEMKRKNANESSSSTNSEAVNE